MSTPDPYLADLTAEEQAAGFAVRPVAHPDGRPATVPAVVYAWGDPSHRLVKARGRDGIVFHLQAFGRRRAGTEAAGWWAERYWPDRYGTAWVLDRLREYLGRPSYRPLVDLRVPPADAAPAAAPGPADLPADAGRRPGLPCCQHARRPPFELPHERH